MKAIALTLSLDTSAANPPIEPKVARERAMTVRTMASVRTIRFLAVNAVAVGEGLTPAIPRGHASRLLPDHFVVSPPCSFANHPSRRGLQRPPVSRDRRAVASHGRRGGTPAAIGCLEAGAVLRLERAAGSRQAIGIENTRSRHLESPRAPRTEQPAIRACRCCSRRSSAARSSAPPYRAAAAAASAPARSSSARDRVGLGWRGQHRLGVRGEAVVGKTDDGGEPRDSGRRAPVRAVGRNQSLAAYTDHGEPD